MRVLTYSQIMSLIKRGKIKLDEVEYTISADIKDFVSDHLPAAASSFVARQFLLVGISTSEGAGEIVMYGPNGPPDPGVTSSQPAVLAP